MKRGIKVLFLNPPFHKRFSREQRSPAVTKSNTLYYPKWLASAAGVAVKKGFSVDLLDAPAEGRDVKFIIDRIEKNQIGAIVCDTSTPSIYNDISVAKRIKEKNSKIMICMVGRHVSALPEETMKLCDAIDVIAMREYEFTVCDWLDAIECGAKMDSVKGLVWRDEAGAIHKNDNREAIQNLDEIPFVTETYRKYLHIENYFYSHSLYPLVVFDTSRGCPYRCTYCVYPQTFSGNIVRYRSVENVVDEFKYVEQEFPKVKAVMLEDDTFIINKERTEKLADELIRRGNRLRFDCNCRADIGGDVKFLIKLRRAGARLFCVGFESGNDEVLQHMNKNMRTSSAIEFMNACKMAGIMVHGCFMMGNLNETMKGMRQTLEFAKRLKPDTAQFFPIMVYPGTIAYSEAKEKGYLTTEDFSQWLTNEGLHNTVINLPNISNRELVKFCDRARREFYIRPRYIAYKALQSLKNRDEFIRNMKGFIRLARYLVSGSVMYKSKRGNEG